jgi:hypothetical protein
LWAPCAAVLAVAVRTSAVAPSTTSVPLHGGAGAAAAAVAAAKPAGGKGEGARHAHMASEVSPLDPFGEADRCAARVCDRFRRCVCVPLCRGVRVCVVLLFIFS